MRDKTKRLLKYGAMGTAGALLLGISLLYALNWLYPFPMKRIDDRLAAASVEILASDQSLLSWRVDREDNRRLTVDIDDVSPWLVEATIAVEDKRFRSHLGVDPIAVTRAIWQNVSRGRRVSGASTITMQTIRLLWPRPRVMNSKLKEAFRAWQLERLVDKNRILEIYFNLAPYGGNIVGAEAASRRYFGKTAKQLNLAEASLLAGLPQSPARLNPLRYPKRALQRRDVVLCRMCEDGVITREQAKQASGEPLEISRETLHLPAEHFAEFALAGTTGTAASLTTTLVPEIQKRVTDLTQPYAESLSGRGVAGPAVVVLSVRDSSVLAYIGNASPASAPGRQIDAARVKRQPGSLMKPFIFALLAARGKISPSARVYDLPRSWRDYAPRNMDREWRGGMSAAEALRQSRNITAVAQLEELGVDAFAEFMADLGLEPGNAARDGLALALGVKEQTLLAMTNAYATLGRLGVWLPVRRDIGKTAAVGKRVVSADAAWLALSALSPPELERQPRLVWKTGTSWNQVDAWAVAVTPEVAVGAEDALPLALAVAEAATEDSGEYWTPPPGIEFREVCAESGALPGWHCEKTLLSPMLAGNHATAPCPVHSPAGLRTAETTATNRGSAAGVRIVSPLDGSKYVATNGSTLPLQAESTAGGELLWFVDGESIGSGKSGSSLAWPMRNGRHAISVVDSAGGSAAVAVDVVAQQFR